MHSRLEGKVHEMDSEKRSDRSASLTSMVLLPWPIIQFLMVEQTSVCLQVWLNRWNDVEVSADFQRHSLSLTMSFEKEDKYHWNVLRWLINKTTIYLILDDLIRLTNQLVLWISTFGRYFNPIENEEWRGGKRVLSSFLFLLCSVLLLRLFSFLALVSSVYGCHIFIHL